MDIASIGAMTSGQMPRKAEVADGLEQAFLSEMLKHAGPRESAGQFGGGLGESQFNSLLNDAYAQAMAQRIDLKLLPRGDQAHG